MSSPLSLLGEGRPLILLAFSSIMALCFTLDFYGNIVHRYCYKCLISPNTISIIVTYCLAWNFCALFLLLFWYLQHKIQKNIIVTDTESLQGDGDSASQHHVFTVTTLLVLPLIQESATHLPL